jgi:hypothetical protein
VDLLLTKLKFLALPIDYIEEANSDCISQLFKEHTFTFKESKIFFALLNMSYIYQSVSWNTSPACDKGQGGGSGPRPAV